MSARSLLRARARWPPTCSRNLVGRPSIGIVALVTGHRLVTLGTTVDCLVARPRASRRSPPSRRCVRTAVAWSNGGGAAADGDDRAGGAPDMHRGGECYRSSGHARWRVAIPGRVAKRPTSASSRCNNILTCDVSFYNNTRTFDYYLNLYLSRNSEQAQIL